MTTLVIQIPCLNEAATLPATLAALPSRIEGIDEIKVLIIDDGSTDGTSDVALAAGVDAVVRLERNRGLARAFATGIHAALDMQADIIVNTDADNQYDGSCIADLVRPILNDNCDLVVGNRPLRSVKEFSRSKRLLQRLGSKVVSVFAGMRVMDAASGFRAFSAEAARRIQVHDSFSYTMETLIQARAKRLKVSSVPVRVNPVERPSRLMASTSQYVYRSAKSIVRAFALYRPFRFFLSAGAVFMVPGLALIARWIWLYATSEQYASRVPSLVLSVVLIIVAVQIWLFGFVADLISTLRERSSESTTDLRFRVLTPKSVETGADLPT